MLERGSRVGDECAQLESDEVCDTCCKVVWEGLARRVKGSNLTGIDIDDYVLLVWERKIYNRAFLH